MPATLGMVGKGVGGLAQAFGGSGKAGPTSTANTVGTNTGSTSQIGSSTQTPNLNPLMSGFQSSLVPALSSMYAEASQPVYGATQIAQVANSGDAATNAASQALSNNLAARGALHSGAEAAGQTQLQQANVANTVGFENSIPLLNKQNEEQQQGNVLNLAEGLTGKALSTASNIGSTLGNTFSNSNQTVTGTGPAFGAGALNNMGALMGNSGFGNAMSNAGKGGGKNSPTASGPSTNYGQAGYQP